MYKEDIILFSVIGLVALLLVLGCVYISYVSCHSKWRDSGMASDWGILQGCRVQLANGRWIPEKNLRELTE